MARISTPRASLLSLKPTKGRAQSERQRLASRDETSEWRRWYKTSRWQQLRMVKLTAARFICCKTGVLLTGKPPAPNSPVVDHIQPHRGNQDLFWAEDNLQVVSKAWHDSIKQAQERADQISAIHPKWLQPSLIPLTIVCGPACSGKSSYVSRHKGPRDLVIDLDVIASDISGEPLHGWDRERWLNAALWRRNNMLGDLGREASSPAAWLIVSEPQARHRDWWAQTLKPERIIVLEVDEVECLRRAKLDGRDMNATEAVVTRWWAEYGRRVGDLRPE